ncbi:Origin recognition complex subunit 5 [Trichoplax sp. H2]|nr:Origin recognition complex subunit 5 [Trichoplax sp. H2]|eukprot:RDD46794.1 Origin recognition complex subunit 5 [Trichoplax sp. H2]
MDSDHLNKRYSKSDIDIIFSKILCRSEQVIPLLLLLDSGCSYCPNIFLYGQASTGKTFAVQNIMNILKSMILKFMLQLPHAFVNCLESQSGRQFYRHIRKSIGHKSLQVNLDRNNYCDNIEGFIKYLKDVMKEHGKAFYMVFDNADRIGNLDSTLFSILLGLKELVDPKITVFLISNLSWEDLSLSINCRQPFLQFFPNYQKDELVTILSQSCKLSDDQSFNACYLNEILGVFLSVCRDLRELSYLAQKCYSLYRKPIDSGKVDVCETRVLWTHFRSHFKSALSKMYLRESNSFQWDKMNRCYGNSNEDTENLSSLPNIDRIQLPLYSKYLLIAAYLASYNPVSSDKKLMKKDKRSGTKASRQYRARKIDGWLSGPKQFSIERILAIFHNIIEDDVPTNINILGQRCICYKLQIFFIKITSLVSLQYLTRNSDETSTTYTCLATFDFIRSISRSVQFDIVPYLFNFS